jgi:hypothetical protein
MMTSRNFGIEIEFIGNLTDATRAVQNAGLACHYEGYTHRVTRHWKVVTDASVGNGGELVSPILSGPEGIEEAKKAVAAVASIPGAAVSRSCGFHVHLAVADFNLRQMKNLVKLFAKYEDILDLYVSQSRRGNGNVYCKSNFAAFAGFTLNAHNAEEHTKACTALFAKVDAAQSINEVLNVFGSDDSCRYHKLNTRAYLRHGTIEIRMHQGTLDAEKVGMWVELCNYLVECAKAISHVANRTDAQGYGAKRQANFWGGKHRTELRKFYQQRAKDLAAPRN